MQRETIQIIPLFSSYEDWFKALQSGKTNEDFLCSICGKNHVGRTSTVFMLGVCYSCWHTYDVVETDEENKEVLL